MSLYPHSRTRLIAALAAAGLCAPLLAGCSGRDTGEAEKIAAINAATARAEAAAARAEKAAAKLNAASASAPEPAVTQEPDETANNDNADNSSSDNNSDT